MISLGNSQGAERRTELTKIPSLMTKQDKFGMFDTVEKELKIIWAKILDQLKGEKSFD